MTAVTAHRSAEAVVMAYLHEVLAGEGPAQASDLVSSPVLRERVAAFRRSFGELEVKPHVVVADGDHVAVHFSARGVHTGTFRGLAPTGRSWTASCSAIYRVEGGRIADFWVVWDIAAILEQIAGPILPEGQKSA